MMRSSYRKEDVTILLKDITGLVEPKPTEEREKQIQSGVHYSEMLPLEYKPSDEYMSLYRDLLERFSKEVAAAIGNLADRLMMCYDKDLVLVSLARAGIPAGVLLKRYMKSFYNADVSHYAISIIKDKGIDKNAMRYILDRHPKESLVFVDGWTGKGAIKNQLIESLKQYPGVSTNLAVVADPAGVADFYGTEDDLLIPSCCLNSTVSGLVSRTFYREDIILDTDFHGAVYYEELEKDDLTYDFIDSIEKYFSPAETGVDEVRAIAEKYKIKDIGKIKPGLGETTRVLLRRVPWKVLISEKYKDDISVSHIIQLAKEKNTPIEYVDLKHYKSCGIIKDLAEI